jgi:hypothetical protein
VDKWRERMRQVTVRERLRESMDEIRNNERDLSQVREMILISSLGREGNNKDAVHSIAQDA